MKKFLSLVLAMIMTMSLVTISAGATEYKDLTDKDEIKYEEAVAVLNRIGVITGYPDGSFQPETELTRGAAAKIIVSLMIGPDAAAALPNTNSPYPDVPAGHTFAGVIGFCKTKGYISGYGDGNFKPTGTLTGYAFAKMLLGALGYSSDIERFTGSGWTMNVANIGNVAGLFDRISFDGAAAVTRDEACQLALNTLKATLVTYGGTSLVNGTTGSYTIQGTQATPRTSNNRDINANIGRKDWYGGNNQGSDYLTLEFGEEHFKDLRLEHDRYDPAHDEFGRPSNEWSYKKVTIGTFPLPADYTFTTQVAHVEDTDGTKEKALGLRNYDLEADGGYSYGWTYSNQRPTATIVQGDTTTLWQNGREDVATFAAKDAKVADIADYTDNGTLVEVYVSYVDADWITDVVVIQTQLMEVKRIGSDYVSLDRVEPDAISRPAPTSTNGAANTGFNLSPIHVTVEQVKDTNEDCYNILKDLKSGDKVAIVPVTTDDGATYEAAEVYVPETVSGALTRVDTYGTGTDAAKKRGAVEITVGGTSYKIANWNDKMWELQAEDIKATRKDVTLLMDKYGNAMLAKDVGETSNFMVVGNYYQSIVGNKVCTFVHGWDIKGNEVDLNLGSNAKITNHQGVSSVNNHVLGELVYYTSADATGDADYVLKHADNESLPAGKDKVVRDVFTNLENTDNDNPVSDDKATFEIKASNLLIPLVENHGNNYAVQNDDAKGNGLAKHANTFDKTSFKQYYYDKDVKFIYVNYVKGEDEIDSVEFKSGVQNVSQAELCQAIQYWPSQAAVDKDLVKAVVIKRESSDASLDRMLYVTDTKGWKEVDKDTNESFYEIEALMYIDGKFVPEQTIIVNKNLQIGDFATYNKVAGTKYEDNYYRVKEFTRFNANPAVLSTTKVSDVHSTTDNQWVKHLMRLGTTLGETTDVNNVSLYPDAGDDGVIASNIYNQSFVLGGYRGNSGTVPASIGGAAGIVNTARAYWYNATENSKYDDIDSFEDLWNYAKASNGKVSLDILFNENPGNDGFRTAYLIVIKSIDAASGSNTPSIGEGEIDLKATNVPGAKITNIVPASRGSELALTIDIPSQGFIATGATTSVKLIATIDGVEDTFTASGLEVGSNRFVTSTLRLNGDEKISIRPANPNTDMVWSSVNVKYFNGTAEAANEIPVANFSVAPAFTTASSTSATGAVAVGLKASKYTGSAVTHEIENIVPSSLVMASVNPVNVAAQALITSGNFVAEGTDYVNVIIKGLTAQTGFAVAADAGLAYKGIFGATGAGTAAAISTIDGKAAHTDTLKVEWTPTTATIAENTVVTFTATVGGTADATVAVYAITLKTSAGDIVIANTANGATGTGTIRMPADDLTITGAEITALPKLSKTATSAKIVDDYKMEITFNAPVNNGTVDAAIELGDNLFSGTGGTVTAVSHTAKSNVVVIELDENFAAGDVITATAGVKNNTLISDVLTGGWTFTVSADADGNLTVAVA